MYAKVLVMLKNRIPSFLIVFVTLTQNYPLNVPLVAAAKQNRAPLIRPANILSDVRNRMKRQPNLPAEKLARYANELLQKKGFDYHFDVCEVIGPNRVKTISATPSSRIIYSYRMAQPAGREITLRFISYNPGDQPCEECFSPIPSHKVTKHEMIIVSGGQRYRLKRPTEFVLDEAELVDGSMKKALRGEAPLTYDPANG